MPYTTTGRKSLKHLRVFAAALLTASLMLSYAACGGNDNQTAGTENVNNTNGQVAATPPPVATPTPQEDTRAMSQDPTAQNLVAVLHDWSGEEIATLNRGRVLSSMWSLRHSSTPYDRDGIDSLISKIQKNHYFKTTPRVKEQADSLEPGLFVVGGYIQKQGELYEYLSR